MVRTKTVDTTLRLDSMILSVDDNEIPSSLSRFGCRWICFNDEDASVLMETEVKQAQVSLSIRDFLAS